jgi:DNA-binding transcriptional LysR family regulator
MKRSPTTLAAAESRIAALITPALESKALAVLEECLGAEVYVRAARGADGIEYKAAPDHAVRLAAAVKIIEFSRGRPGTSLTVTLPPGAGNQPSLPDLGRLIAENPDVAESIFAAVVGKARKVTPLTPTESAPG